LGVGTEFVAGGLDDTGLFGGTLAHGGDMESEGVFLFL
jgi:hypothetical protein